MALSKEDYIRAGLRSPGRNLVDQANATIKLAADDLKALKGEELLDDKELKDARDLVAAVDAGLKDRTVAEAEARTFTGAQDDLLRKMKVLRRKLRSAGARALRGSTDLDEFNQRTARGSSIPRLKEEVKAKLAIVARNAEAFKSKGAGPRFVALVEKTLADLETADAAQEASLSSLPPATREFSEKKGRLYYAVKDLNDAGRSLYADDVEKAARYNLRILYRRGGAKKATAAVAAAGSK